MERLIKSRSIDGYDSIVAPGAMKFLEFGRLKLQKGQHHESETGPREFVADVFSGAVGIGVTRASRAEPECLSIERRGDVFSGLWQIIERQQGYFWVD